MHEHAHGDEHEHEHEGEHGYVDQLVAIDRACGSVMEGIGEMMQTCGSGCFRKE
jgi:hypothetical protein